MGWSYKIACLNVLLHSAKHNKDRKTLATFLYLSPLLWLCLYDILKDVAATYLNKE